MSGRQDRKLSSVYTVETGWGGGAGVKICQTEMTREENKEPAAELNQQSTD